MSAAPGAGSLIRVVRQEEVHACLGLLSEQTESVPRKVRDLIHDLLDAGFYQIQGGGKARIGSFRTPFIPAR